MREGGPAFPDTFWLSPRALKRGGCSTADIRQAREAFVEELSMAGEEADEELSSEEESVGEDEDDAGVDGGEGQGQGQAREGQVDAEAEIAAGGEILQQTVGLVAY